VLEADGGRDPGEGGNAEDLIRPQNLSFEENSEITTGTVLERRAFRLIQIRHQGGDDAFAADDARQRQSGIVDDALDLVTDLGDAQHRALVVGDRLDDARKPGADAVPGRPLALDDGVGRAADLIGDPVRAA
jgi:hypothetical protein